MWSFKEGAENLPEKDVESFRALMQEKYGETLSSTEARFRYCELMSLFWLLAHKPPTPGGPPPESLRFLNSSTRTLFGYLALQRSVFRERLALGAWRGAGYSHLV